MSCLPPDQMPPDPPSHSQPESESMDQVVLYPSLRVGVDAEQQRVAIILSPLTPGKRPLPAFTCGERDAARLIYQLQQCLLMLRQLPPLEVPYD